LEGIRVRCEKKGLAAVPRSAEFVKTVLKCCHAKERIDTLLRAEFPGKLTEVQEFKDLLAAVNDGGSDNELQKCKATEPSDDICMGLSEVRRFKASIEDRIARIRARDEMQLQAANRERDEAILAEKQREAEDRQKQLERQKKEEQAAEDKQRVMTRREIIERNKTKQLREKEAKDRVYKDAAKEVIRAQVSFRSDLVNIETDVKGWGNGDAKLIVVARRQSVQHQASRRLKGGTFSTKLGVPEIEKILNTAKSIMSASSTLLAITLKLI
jgi:hypothetical protein